MTKKHSTKSALVASILAMCMCFTMLVGTTFAWFTDSVTSSGNVIQTGKLDVAMYWVEGDEDPDAVTEWNEAKGAIFNNDKWEPGYVEAKHIKIANEGTLALKYQMRILANGVVSELAEVIDVYYFADAKQLTDADFVQGDKLGTLSEVLNVAHAKNISNTIAGNLEAGASKTVTLVFKMQESAGNEYQNLSIGSDFTIQLLATQYTSENDSFDNLYDKDASFPAQEVPTANVFILNQSKLAGITAGTTGATLDVGYSFQPTENYDDVEGTEKASWHADFFVYADKQVPAESMALAGYYNAFNGLNFNGQKLSETNWIALTSPTAIAAGAANGVRLIESMGVSVPYLSVCEYGNDGTGFLCGAADLTGANEGTTLTVELRLYKTYAKGTCPGGDACADKCCTEGNCGSANCETGEYITVGKFTYTFGGEYVTLADGAVAFASDDGEVWLRHTANVEVDSNGVYYVPDGVTCVGQANGSPEHGGFQVFSSNSDIKKVVFPDSVTSIGYQAFKGSAVEEVVINDGITEIGAFAFNNAKSLKTYNIPDSVTSIGKQAFASTAASEIVIPESVEFIDEGAFRYMSNLTTVTIKGNPEIANFAFRDNPALMNVYLLGDDITFTGTMTFAFFSNGNATGMTIYVANATMAARVYAAQKSAYGYEVKVLGDAADGSDAGEVAQAATDAALESAISEGASTVLLSSGTYSVPSAVAGKDITIAGAGDTTVIDFSNTAASVGDANITFENLKITGKNSNTMNGYGIQSTTGDIVYKNCTFENAFTSEFYGNVYYYNCTFVGTYYISTYAVDSATFVGCTFDRTDSRALLVYSHGDNPVKVLVKDCTFTADDKAYTYTNEWTAAIEVDTTNIPSAGTTVTIENCTYDENYNGIVRDKSTAGKENSVITVDGVVVDNATIKTTGYSLNK